jgi:hypothetical protein
MPVDNSVFIFCSDKNVEIHILQSHPSTGSQERRVFGIAPIVLLVSSRNEFCNSSPTHRPHRVKREQ